MKKKFHSFVGIDVSKKTFDVGLRNQKNGPQVYFKRFPNNLIGYEELLEFFKKHKLRYDTTLVCMENTGVYHRMLANLLSSDNIEVWVESGYEIKWSMGLQRGKSDKIDAERIMMYASRNQDKSKKYEVKDETIQLIGDLLGARARVIDCIKALKVPIGEMLNAGLKEASSKVEQCTFKSVQSLEQDLKRIEKEILSTIKSNPEIKQKYDYVISVKSVGFVAASYLLYYTNGFTKFKSSKQLASFSGIAPFEYSSGTSIRGKTKVHHMANKKLKTILHLCAVSSIVHNPEMKSYYERKLSEGKNKMLVLNSIRNKILSRVYSCVKNQRIYTEKYQFSM